MTKEQVLHAVRTQAPVLRIYYNEISSGKQQTLNHLVSAIKTLLRSQDSKDRQRGLVEAHELALSAYPQSIAALYQQIVPSLLAPAHPNPQQCEPYLSTWIAMYDGSSRMMRYPDFRPYQSCTKWKGELVEANRFREFQANLRRYAEQKVQFFDDSFITEGDEDNDARVLQIVTYNIAELEKIKQRVNTLTNNNPLNASILAECNKRVLGFKAHEMNQKFDRLLKASGSQKVTDVLAEEHRWCDRFVDSYALYNQKSITAEELRDRLSPNTIILVNGEEVPVIEQKTANFPGLAKMAAESPEQQRRVQPSPASESAQYISISIPKIGYNLESTGSKRAAFSKGIGLVHNEPPAGTSKASFRFQSPRINPVDSIHIQGHQQVIHLESPANPQQKSGKMSSYKLNIREQVNPPPIVVSQNQNSMISQYSPPQRPHQNNGDWQASPERMSAQVQEYNSPENKTLIVKKYRPDMIKENASNLKISELPLSESRQVPRLHDSQNRKKIFENAVSPARQTVQSQSIGNTVYPAQLLQTPYQQQYQQPEPSSSGKTAFKLSQFTQEKQKRKQVIMRGEFGRAPDWLISTYVHYFDQEQPYSRFRRSCLNKKSTLLKTEKLEATIFVDRVSSKKVAIKIRYKNLSDENLQVKTVYKISKEAFRVTDQKGVKSKFIIPRSTSEDEQTCLVVHNFSLQIVQFPLGACSLELSINKSSPSVLLLPVCLNRFVSMEYLEKEEWFNLWNKNSGRKFYASRRVLYQKKVFNLNEVTFLIPELTELGGIQSYSFDEFGCKCRYQYYGLEFQMLVAFNVDNVLTIELLCCNDASEEQREFLDYYLDTLVMLIQKLNTE